MRFTLFILFVMMSGVCIAQENWMKQDRDTFLYAFNSEWEPIEPHEAATYIRKAWPLNSELFYVFDYYKDGSIQMKATAKNHDPLAFEEYVSGQIRYTETGDTLSYCKYNDTSALQGKYRSFYQSGSIESFGKFENNKRIGNWSTFYENGQLESRGTYVDGFRQGDWVFYHENGQLQKNVNFNQGQYRGKVTEYFNNGSVYTNATYNNDGQRDGLYERYSIDGELIDSSEYSNGKKKEEKRQEDSDDIMFDDDYDIEIWNGAETSFSAFKKSIASELTKASKGWAKDRGVYQFELNPEGKVTSVTIIETCNDVIDEAVKLGVLNTEWKPATRGNTPVASGNEMIVWFNYSTIDRIELGKDYTLDATKPTRTATNGQIFHIVEEQAQYPGGTDQLMKFLIENTRYPAKAREEGATGVVYVQFVVGRSGIVSHPEILRGVHPSLDFEAMRVVKEMPAWTAGRQRGKTVPVYYKLPFRFNLK